MRTKLLLAGALALLAFAGTAQTTPLACADDCVVTTVGEIYVSPALEVRSGASVTWTSLSGSHVNTDGSPLHTAGACFFVGYGEGVDTPEVRFDIVGGTLTATVDDVTRTCDNAQPLPGGSFGLPYYCVIHGAMRGALVVSP